MNNEILLLTDYRSSFYCSTTRRRGIDLELLHAQFAAAGYHLNRHAYSELDFRQTSYAGQYVLYQSSEDAGLEYKSYLEDVLLILQMQGALLVPRFECFRAHHNKVFMELLRDALHLPELSTLHSYCFGTYEDFTHAVTHLPPVLVMKPSAGAGSLNVHLVDTIRAKKRVARRLSKSAFPGWQGIKDIIAGWYYKDYTSASWYRRKFVAQNYIANLMGDFKVLVFGEKYYVLQRENRPKDFRASGSGRFTWPENPAPELLNCAKTVFQALQVPFLSMDIAHDGQSYHVLEFQFLSFGHLTMQRSQRYFTEQADGWTSIAEAPVLEREIAASVVRYIEQLTQKTAAP